MIKTYKNSLQDKKLKEVKDFTPFSWICVTLPTEEEIAVLNKKLKVSLETLNDCVDEYELPRVKTENRNLIVTLRAAVKVDSLYETIPITLILSRNYITTITTRDLQIIDDLKNQKVKIYTTQHSNFLINLSLTIIAYFQNYINAINRDVQAKKRKIINISKSDVFALVEIEEILDNFITALVPNIDVIKKILNLKYIDFYERDKVLIDDLSVDAEQVLNLSKNNLRTVNNIREGYTTVLSIRRNQIIKILTYLTAFLTVPMVIASVYGMNVKLPFGESPDAFLILTIITFSIMFAALIAFITFRKRL